MGLPTLKHNGTNNYRRIKCGTCKISIVWVMVVVIIGMTRFVQISPMLANFKQLGQFFTVSFSIFAKLGTCLANFVYYQSNSIR